MVVVNYKKNYVHEVPVNRLYPYSTQATNRPNRHELIFYLFGGIREVSLKNIPQSWCSTSQSRFRYDVGTNIRGDRLNWAGIAKEFITISIIKLEHAARKLRNQLRIS